MTPAQTYDEAGDRLRNEAVRCADIAFRLAILAVVLGVVGLVLGVASLAGAASRPDYGGLGGCAPDVASISIDPAGAHVEFTVPDGCDLQHWVIIVEDYRPNHGSNVPSEGRRRVLTEPVTATAGAPLVYDFTPPAALCGGQVDLVLEGEDQPYAAAVFETAGCENVGTTALPPPVPDNTTPPGAATSVEGVTGSGGGAGADTVASTTTPAGPAPLVEIATQPRVGALPAALPATGGFSGQLAVIGLAAFSRRHAGDGRLRA